MSKRPRVTLCAAITVDGKLDDGLPPEAWAEIFAPQPGDVLLVDHRAAKAASPARRLVAVDGRADLAVQLRGLRVDQEVRRVFCLGGPTLFRRLLDENLVDELCLRVRLRIDGRRGATTLSGVPGEYFPASIHLRLLAMEVRGDECVLHYRVRRTVAKRPVGA